MCICDLRKNWSEAATKESLQNYQKDSEILNKSSEFY